MRYQIRVIGSIMHCALMHFPTSKIALSLLEEKWGIRYDSIIYHFRTEHLYQIKKHIRKPMCFFNASSELYLLYKSGIINKATMFMILINGLIAGPAVSL